MASTARPYESTHYLLPADKIETSRLNVQHQMIVKACDGKLLSAPVSLKDGDRVLESGAGTGIWVLEFAAQQPITVSITGIDISSRQYPTSCPSNVHLAVESITKLPDDWNNTFVLVHQRFLMVALTTSTWQTAISEIFRVLTPGGWAELLEVATLNCTLGVGPNSRKLVQLIHKLFSEKVVEDLDIQLPIMLRDAGFVNIEIKSRPIATKQDVGDGIDRTRHMYDKWMGMKKPMLETGGHEIVGSEQKFDEMMKGAMEEWRESEEATYDYFMVYAQKKAE